MQHVEFFHKDHFENRYRREKARPTISGFIDFFWETDFDTLWKDYPEGFSDALFPNIGYTYLINLGTPYVMQLDDRSYDIKSDSFLPRHRNMICYHSHGNRIFGIKFRVSPVIFEKKVNFFEYREFIYPLAYLMERQLIDRIKKAEDFASRVNLLTMYYEDLVAHHEGTLKQVEIVTEVLDSFDKNGFRQPVEEIATNYSISTRTLQRYFEAATGVSCKQAQQIMRIRKAVERIATQPEAFHFSDFGYYDYSHFHKHLKGFINSHTISIVKPHLRLLKPDR